MKILPNYFWQPIQVRQPSFPEKVGILLDTFFTNPFNQTWKVSRNRHGYRQIDTIQSSRPLLHAIVRVAFVACLFFSHPVATFMLTIGLFGGKFFFRHYHDIYPQSPHLAQPPAVLEAEEESLEQRFETKKQNIIGWVQKYSCIQDFYLFALGIADTEGLEQDLEDEGKEDIHDVQVEIHNGEEYAEFSRHFLESIPFFAALIRNKMQEVKTTVNNKTVLHLDGLSPFTLTSLKKIQEFDDGKHDSTDGSFLSEESLDFLGLRTTLQAMRTFKTLQKLKNFILNIHGNPDEILQFQDINLGQLSDEGPPQVKVTSSTASEIRIDDEKLEERIKELEVALSDTPNALETEAVAPHLSQMRERVLSILEEVYKTTPLKITRTLATNRLIEAYLQYLLEMGRNHNDQEYLTNEFLALINASHFWHPHVTILNLPSEFDHKQLPQVTQRLTSLYWLKLDFFVSEPENLLDWIHTWNKDCTQLKVLALGLSHDEGVHKSVRDEMKTLKIFEFQG